MERAAVIGAGAWGTTLARHVAEKGLSVTLWAYEPEVVDSIRTKHENLMFLPGVPLPPSLHATESLGDAIRDADLLVFAVPSHAARPVLRELSPLLLRAIPIISATKGIEDDSLQLMTQVMAETLAPPFHDLL